MGIKVFYYFIIHPSILPGKLIQRSSYDFTCAASVNSCHMLHLIGAITCLLFEFYVSTVRKQVTQPQATEKQK